MRISGSRAYYRPTPPKMPPGLVELIEGLTREVLKNNPTDIYGFCAGYVHQLLEIRDSPPRIKSLTLEEKIARAQQKIRERAEKRRQQINADLQHTLECGKVIECNAISNKTNASSPSQISSVTDTVQIPSPHEKELYNPPELEHSHAKEILTQIGELQLENTNIDKIKYSDNDINKSELTKEEYINNLVTDKESNVNKEDSDLHKPPKDEYDIKEVNLLDNDILSERTVLTPEKEIVLHGQTSHDENLTEDNEKFKNIIADEQSSSSVPNSMSVSQQLALNNSGEKMIEDIAEVIAITGDCNIEQVEQNALMQSDLIRNGPQNDEGNSDVREELHKETDENIIILQQFSDQSELSTDNIITDNNEDTESKTIHISYNEPSTVELQDPSDNSNSLKSQLEVNSDGDILTILTHESNNNECKENITLKNEFLNTEQSDETVKNDNKVTMSFSIPEVSHIETGCDTIDGTENSSVVSINNEKYYKSENDTTTEFSEGSQNNQDTTNTMDLETAAITIQKVFRSFLFKSRASTFEEVSDEAIFLNGDVKNKENCNYNNEGSSNERRTHGITRMDTVLQTVNEEKSLSLSTDDSSTLSSAATIIQAHVRGFLVRNKLNSNKTLSNSSFAVSHSNEPSLTSLEIDNDQNKNKTVLNIHIVPDGSNYLSRDESLITSMDLSLDSSPPSSINLHPLGYDKSERRKQLKREDAIQSISPPSNNSGKLSEDIDSVKELPITDQDVKNNSQEGIGVNSFETANAENTALRTNANSKTISVDVTDNPDTNKQPTKESLSKMSSDEMDVVTPFMSNEDNNCSDMKLMHSGEFHDAVLPTKVSRSDTTVASEFKNVLVYFLLWNN